jgi:hypothetical protein
MFRLYLTCHVVNIRRLLTWFSEKAEHNTYDDDDDDDDDTVVLCNIQL